MLRLEHLELQQESWGRNYWGEPQHHSTDTTFLLHISPRMSTCIPTVRGTTRYFCVFTFREVGLLCGSRQAGTQLPRLCRADPSSTYSNAPIPRQLHHCLQHQRGLLEVPELTWAGRSEPSAPVLQTEARNTYGSCWNSILCHSYLSEPNQAFISRLRLQRCATRELEIKIYGLPAPAALQ